jgi:hypothetical protein
MIKPKNFLAVTQNVHFRGFIFKLYLPITTGKQNTFIGLFIFLGIEEYSCTIFLGT